jgi:thiamine transport system ATP-binding protein
MFQDYALFPHLSVEENVTFGPRMAGAVPEQAHQRAETMLDLVGLPGFGPRDVTTLSGGEAQRVALARALAPGPQLLMLDEPLGALDRALRERLLDELGRVLRSIGQTALYVTHDQEEAFALADRVVLMRSGRVVQEGTPVSLYRTPADAWCARFLGLDNLLDGVARDVGDGTWVADTAIGPIPLPGPAARSVTVLIRPDAATLGEGGWGLQGFVVERSFRGPSTRLTLTVGGQPLTFTLASRVDVPAPGSTIRLALDPAVGVQVLPARMRSDDALDW